MIVKRTKDFLETGTVVNLVHSVVSSKEKQQPRAPASKHKIKSAKRHLQKSPKLNQNSEDFGDGVNPIKRKKKYKTIEEKPVKIDKWDNAALKNALDDGAKKVMLEKFGFTESHRLMDGRLAICTIAVGFAAFALIWDYFRPFPESRPVLITCVVSYFILMGVLTAYTTYFEKGIFLVALDKDRAKVDPDNRWELSSSLKKYDDTYTLSMVFTDGKTNKSRSQEIKKSVAEYFDEDGRFCFDLFEPEVRMLQNRIATSKKE